MSAKKIFLVVCAALIATAARAQTYLIDWSAVTAGGGTLTGGGYSLDGSIGDLSAGFESSAQGYTLEGGVVPGSEAFIPAQWVLRATNGPPARYGHAMAFDSARGVTVMFGGNRLSDDHSRYEDFGDVWEWNGTEWRQRTTFSLTSGWVRDPNTGYSYPDYEVPVARFEHAMAYDSKRGRVVMFGGQSFGPDNGQRFLGDTWEWDGLKWQFRASNGPLPRFSHAMAYDASRGVTVLVNGYSPGEPGLLWEWDGNSWKSNAPSSGPASGQISAAMAYDDARHKVFYGPTSDGFRTVFFWTWNGAAWNSEANGFTDVLPSPPYGAMVFDSYRRKSVFFGGNGYGYCGLCGGSMMAFYETGVGQLRSQWTLQPDMASTSLLKTNDFINPAIVIQLRQHTDPLSDYLWNQLSASTQQTLTDPGASIDQQLSALVIDFNRIIGSGTSLYDPARFSAVALSVETLAFQIVTPRGADLVRFNRLLLEDYYPSAIAKSASTPPGRLHHAMAYDSRRHAVVLFGGLTDSTSPSRLTGNETWELVTLDELVINQQPLSQFRAPGDNAFFTVGARSRTGAALNYQWFLGSQALNDVGRISGAHSATLQIANVTTGDVGPYHVRVSDTRGSADSVTATLTLDPQLHLFNVDLFHLVWGLSNVVLQHSEVVTGNWATVPGANSPFDIAPLGAGKFFRLQPSE